MFFALVISAPLIWPERSAFRTAVGSLSGLRTILVEREGLGVPVVRVAHERVLAAACRGAGSSLYGPEPDRALLERRRRDRLRAGHHAGDVAEVGHERRIGRES
jgi:hypothetical protein